MIARFVEMFEETKKSESESVNRRRTDNTMANKKGQKDKQRSTKHIGGIDKTSNHISP
jgi:hypothetical protein